MDWTLTATAILAAIATILSAITVDAADPVYSPATLNDSAGNAADADASVTWADLPTGASYSQSEPERVTAGLETYYGMMRGFINTAVFPKGLPDDIITKAANNESWPITSEYNTYVPYVIGYGICIGIGLLFVLLFPLIGCCFCCCRCCGNCGGKRVQKEKDAANKCKRNTYIVIELGVLILATVGCVCLFINNQQTSAAIKKFPDAAVDNLNGVNIYINNTVDQANHIAKTNFEFLRSSLIRDMDNIAYLVGLPLRKDIEDNTAILATIASAYSLDDKLTEADAALTHVDDNITALSTSITALQTAMSNVASTLDTIFSNCSGDCPAGAPDYTMTVQVDTNQFPNLTQSKADMATATDSNLTATVADAETELKVIPQRVDNDSLSTRDTMKNNINSLSDDIDPMVNKITDLNDMVSGSSATIDLDKLKEDIRDFGETAEKYDKFRWYGGLGLAYVVLFILALAFLGMAFGVLGCNMDIPTSQRGCMSNTGGICLMASVVFIFMFSAVLMLLTVIPFLLGAPLDKFLCQPITDTSFDTLEDLVDVQYNNAVEGTGKYFMGKQIFKNNTINITLSGLFRDCKNGESAYNAFRLSNLFDLDDMLNYSKTLDVQSEIDSINVDLSSVNVYPQALQDQMANMTNAININFTQFYTELGNSATNQDLDIIAADLDAYAANVTSPFNDSIHAQANAIRDIKTNEYAAVLSNKNALNDSVAAMEAAVAPIPTMISGIDTGLSAANTYINTTTPTVVVTILNSYASRLLGIADSYVNYTSDAVKNKMGLCTPIWNIYNSMVVYGFCYNIMDTLNGFWFSLGWCILFFMPSLVFSVKLAKYFRRTLEEDEFGIESDVMVNNAYPDQTVRIVADALADLDLHCNNKGRLEPPEVYNGPAKPHFPTRRNKVQHSDNARGGAW